MVETIKEQKERRLKKTNCGCGGKYCHTQKSRHFKTEKHLAYLKTLENILV